MNKFLLAAALTPHPPILLPEIGRGEECRAASTTAGLNIIAERIAELAPETCPNLPACTLAADKIRLINQSELRGSMAQFGQPQVRLSFANDDELLQQVMSSGKGTGSACPTLLLLTVARDSLDHGAFVPLYFINRKYSDFRLLEIAFGFLPPALLFEFGQILADAIESLGRRTVIIASVIFPTDYPLTLTTVFREALALMPRSNASLNPAASSNSLPSIRESVKPPVNAVCAVSNPAGILENCDYDTELLSYRALGHRLSHRLG